MSKSAKMNHTSDSYPMDGVRYTKPVRAVDDIHFLTVEEQHKFLKAAKSTHNFYQYTHLYKICDENGIKRFCMHASGGGSTTIRAGAAC